MKTGDQVFTLAGQGTVVEFEAWPPIVSGKPKEIWREFHDKEGYFVRVGVNIPNHDLPIAYFSLNEVKSIPQ